VGCFWGLLVWAGFGGGIPVVCLVWVGFLAEMIHLGGLGEIHGCVWSASVWFGLCCFCLAGVVSLGLLEI